MSSPFKPSAACCSRPPFILPDLPLRGEIIKVNNRDTYTTGSPSATHGILVVHDIFGFFPQTLYGADVLAYGTGPTDTTSTQDQVFVPDLLGSDAADYAWYPPTTPEKAAALDAFFAGPAETRSTLAKLRSVWAALARLHPEITDWALIGYCWGGEVAQYAVGSDLVAWNEAGAVGAQQEKHPFKALVLLHSGFMDDEEIAKGIDVPVLVLNSGEETREEMEAFVKGTAAGGVKVQVEWFMDMVHGWMSARGGLSDGKVMDQVLKGYRMIREFLELNL